MPKSTMTKSSFRLRAVALAACCGVLLVGCGGGSSTTKQPEPEPEPSVSVNLPANLPTDYAPAAGSMTIPAGESRTSNGVVFSCASGGDNCEVMVAANGAVTSTGGRVTTDLTQAVKDILASDSNNEKQTMQRTAANTAIATAVTAVSGVDNDSTDDEVSSAETAVNAAEDAVNAATALSEEERGQLMAQVTSARTKLTTAKADRKDAIDKAMAKAGKDLHGAMAGTTTTNTALNNIESYSLTSAGLAIDAASNAGTLTTDPGSVTLEAGDPADPLGSWKGMHYEDTMGTGSAKVTNEALVYTNQGSQTSMTFVEKYGDDGVYTASTRTYDVGTAADAKIKASAFPTAGSKTFTGVQSLPGTYDGASGDYKCNSDCTVTATNDGSVELSYNWTFVHDVGALTSTPDNHYLYFGWWVRKDNKGVPTVASAFAGRLGTEPGDSTDGLDPGADGSTLAGSATYAGKAIGKFALSNPLDGTGNGGHFTADAMLKATFGSGSDAGMTGTIDNFRLNDGSKDPGWSVSLHRAGWGGEGAIQPPEDNSNTVSIDEALGTTWSIGDNEADASGTWSGQMYDEKPGNAPNGDGSNVPTTVTGTFYSEFSTVGRMVGAFGANKQ